MVVFGEAVRDVSAAKDRVRLSEPKLGILLPEVGQLYHHATGGAAEAAAPPTARTGLLTTKSHNNVGVTLWENVLTGRGHVVY